MKTILLKQTMNSAFKVVETFEAPSVHGVLAFAAASNIHIK